MKLFEKFSTQHLGKDYEIQAHFGLKLLTDEQIKKVQKISLEIYKDILAVCEQNHLVVMMGGGSVLGTIRHKGFIPWDDDMDLMMSREDYEKFINLFDTTLSHKYNINIKSELPGVITRIEKKNTIMTGILSNPQYPQDGIGVDITPIDSVPDNKLIYYIKGILITCLFVVITSRRVYALRTSLSQRYFCQTLPMTLVYYMRLCIGFLSCIVPYKKLHYWFDKFVASSKKTKYVTIASGRKHYFGETLPTEIFFPVKRRMFENVIAYVPNDYDRYLSNLYGNYMKMPPEDKREHHTVVDFIINE